MALAAEWPQAGPSYWSKSSRFTAFADHPPDHTDDQPWRLALTQCYSSIGFRAKIAKCRAYVCQLPLIVSLLRVGAEQRRNLDRAQKRQCISSARSTHSDGSKDMRPTPCSSLTGKHIGGLVQHPRGSGAAVQGNPHSASPNRSASKAAGPPARWHNVGMPEYAENGSHDRSQYPHEAEILELLSDGVARLDRNWTVSYLNSAGRGMLGLNIDPVGRNHWECFPGMVYPDSPWTTSYYAAMNEAKSNSFEAFLRGAAQCLGERSCRSGAGRHYRLFPRHHPRKANG